MYSASDYRSMARRALKNYWWLAVGVTLLANTTQAAARPQPRVFHQNHALTAP